MRRLILAVASGLALTALAPAQTQLVRELDSQLAKQSVGSVSWYVTSLDRVAALAEVDLRKALAAAKDLYAQAAESGPVGFAQTFAARVAFMTVIHEGPIAALPWDERASRPSKGTDARCLADYFLTRARSICSSGKHGDELPLTIQGRRSADEAKDWPRKVQAALMTVHLSPTRGVFHVNQLFRDAQSAGHGDLVAFLRPSVSLKRVDRLISRGDLETARAELERIEAMAKVQGNERVLGHVVATRAEMAVHDGLLEEGLQLWATARKQYESYGNLVDAIFAIDASAEICITLGRVADARALIEEQEKLLEGRGWRLSEDNLLITRFHLAVKEHDGPLADKLSDRIDKMIVADTTEEERAVDASERLAEAELERSAAERQLQEIELRFAQRSRSVWMWSSIAGGLGLGLLLGVSWWGRRRLLLANQKLADKVRQVEEGRAEQKRLEDRMRQMERTEGLGTLAAGIAHDFNNLLTSMIGGAELLGAQDKGGEHKEQTDMILAAGQQGARLCRQLQSYSGGTPLMREPHDLSQITAEMLPTLQASVKGGLDVKLVESAAILARVDRGQFEQILLNLVLNSHEAGAKTVTITIRKEAADEHGRAAAHAVLDIADDGAGMSEEVAQRIFDPFFTTKFPGRGLGLAVVFGGVRRHGGRVSVHSPETGGSCFTIRLPLAEKDVVLPRPPAAGKGPRSDAKAGLPVPVLIVDDEHIVRLALKSMLAKLGVRAQDFATGVEALAFVEQLPEGQGCVAMVDLTMPEMDGSEVIEKLRAMDRPVRCVLMSGHADEYVKECASKLGMEQLLAKPFSMDRIREVVEELAEDMQSVN